MAKKEIKYNTIYFRVDTIKKDVISSIKSIIQLKLTDSQKDLVLSSIPIDSKYFLKSEIMKKNYKIAELNRLFLISIYIAKPLKFWLFLYMSFFVINAGFFMGLLTFLVSNYSTNKGLKFLISKIKNKMSYMNEKSTEKYLNESGINDYPLAILNLIYMQCITKNNKKRVKKLYKYSYFYSFMCLNENLKFSYQDFMNKTTKSYEFKSLPTQDKKDIISRYSFIMSFAHYLINLYDLLRTDEIKESYIAILNKYNFVFINMLKLLVNKDKDEFIVSDDFWNEFVESSNMVLTEINQISNLNNLDKEIEQKSIITNLNQFNESIKEITNVFLEGERDKVTKTLEKVIR